MILPITILLFLLFEVNSKLPLFEVNSKLFNHGDNIASYCLLFCAIMVTILNQVVSNHMLILQIFNKSLLAKFAWAMDVDPQFRF